VHRSASDCFMPQMPHNSSAAGSQQHPIVVWQGHWLFTTDIQFLRSSDVPMGRLEKSVEEREKKCAEKATVTMPKGPVHSSRMLWYCSHTVCPMLSICPSPERVEVRTTESTPCHRRYNRSTRALSGRSQLYQENSRADTVPHSVEMSPNLETRLDAPPCLGAQVHFTLPLSRVAPRDPELRLPPACHVATGPGDLGGTLSTACRGPESTNQP
jgi:hypothetical protein